MQLLDLQVSIYLFIAELVYTVNIQLLNLMAASRQWQLQGIFL